MINAISIGTQTLLGTNNCFSVGTEGGQYYQIVNFYVERLREALKRGLISWPVKITPLNDKVAIINDERIDESWYNMEYCQVCCPDELLTDVQKIKIERDILRGFVILGKGFKKYDLSKIVRWGKPNDN